MRRIVRFALVGAVGFAADLGTLAVLVRDTPIGPYLARIASIAVAVTVTWLLNRTFTFEPSERGLAKEGARYGSIGIGCNVLNFMVYSSLLLLVPDMPAMVAVALSSATASLTSYAGYSLLVFNR